VLARTLLVALLLCGCSKSEPPPKPKIVTPGEKMVDGRCQIAFSCPPPCGDLEAKWASIQQSKSAQCKGAAGCPVLADRGTCARDRYTRYRDAMGDEVTWFHPDGKAFARHVLSPHAIFCDGQSKEGFYGPVPTCILTPDP